MVAPRSAGAPRHSSARAVKSWLRLDVWKSSSALHQYYIN